MTFRQSSVGSTHIHTRTRPTRAYHPGHVEQHQVSNQPHAHPPQFSVVVCTYNRRNMVLTLLSCLRKQTLPYKDFEIIVVDNGSSDGTFNAVQTYLSADSVQRHATGEPLHARCLLEPHNGLAYARNTGLQAAKGEIVIFLDDDVIIDGQFLTRLQKAYDETHADAIGGCVEIRWEAQRPFWLTADLLDMLGYYMPFRSRIQLPETLSFSSSCFSVKRAALQKIGPFPPYLGKRLNTPVNVEVIDLCRRLRKAGNKLWYDPSVNVAHRITRARLEKAFLIGRAYWQGRSEILAQYADIECYPDAAGSSLWNALRSIIPELREFLHLALIHQPLLYLTRKSTHEQLISAMAQARSWGRLQQQFMLSNHAPITMHTPAVLLVRADCQDGQFLLKGLAAQKVHYHACTADIPFAWIWRYRAHQEQSIGVIHFYRPGAYNLNQWQRQRMLFKIWLAQWLGIRIASTDAGGWWQNVRSLQFTSRRAFERQIFSCSNVIHTFTRHPEQQYLEGNLRRHACFVAHPGLAGSLPNSVERQQARTLLGLPGHTGFTYACFADRHSEREIIQLIEAFTEMRTLLFQKEETAATNPQLILIGTPRDKANSLKILKRAALNSAIHLFLAPQEDDVAIFMGAADAVVMPYIVNKTAGEPGLAMLSYSYERIVIAPELPRFKGLLPPHAAVLYNPASHTSLIQSMLLALGKTYQHTEREATTLHAEQSWHHYAQRILEIYRPLLKKTTRL